MPPLAEAVIFIFGLIGLGYAAAWSGYLGRGVAEGLTEFAVGVALPVLLFRTMADSQLDSVPWLLWLCYFSSIAITWAVGQTITVKVFGRDARAGVVGGVASSFSNLVLMGSPFTLAVFGQAGFGMLALIIALHLPVMMAASIVLFTWADRKSGGGSASAAAVGFLHAMITNPLIVGIVAGVVWRVAGLGLPGVLGRLVEAVATIAAPLALISIGMSLRNFGLSGNLGPAMGLSAVKLVVMPALVLAMALLLGLPPLAAQIAVVGAAMPAGVNPYLIATRFGTGQALASNTTTITTLCAAVTAAFWLAVARAVFGT